MLDLSHTPKGFAGAADQQIFYGGNGSNGGSVQVWEKPRGISMIHMFALGCGGPGTAGSIGATATGGAGGGSGGQGSLLIPALFVPDVLFIWACVGGTTTTIGVRPYGASPTASPIALDSFLSVLGTNTNTGATAGSLSVCVLGGKGITQFLAGIAGGTAGAVTPTAGGAVAANATGLVVSGGGGGGGMSAAATAAGGAAFTTAMTTGYTGAAGGAGGTSGVAGGAGKSGISLPTQLILGGGGGGGSGFPTATVSAGGNGGDGAWGCGGGGGGGGLTGQTASLGGKGGGGLVIITCW